jgi:hypothetical protein
LCAILAVLPPIVKFGLAELAPVIRITWTFPLATSDALEREIFCKVFFNVREHTFQLMADLPAFLVQTRPCGRTVSAYLPAMPTLG